MIQAEHITKTFNGFMALDDMSLHVPKGTIYGLVGPNGAGKSISREFTARTAAPSSLMVCRYMTIQRQKPNSRTFRMTCFIFYSQTHWK